MRLLLPIAFVCSVVSGYTWKNVKIGGGGGFIPGIEFHPTVQGVAYARADIGGLYRLNSDDSWTPLEDWANDTNWHDWGVTGIGLDAKDAMKVYISVGMYTNSWDPNVGSILRSSDQGATWAETKLPFKLPGNQPGRGVGERLVVDPANSNLIYFAAPSGNGLWKSTDQGVTFSKVASFTAVGNYAEDPSDSTGYQSDLTGLTSIVFDTTSGMTNGATSRIFVGTAYVNAASVYVSNDAGATWTAVVGQPIGWFPKRMKFSAAEEALYISFNNVAGPYDAGNGSVYRYATNGTWKNITPAWEAANSLTFGYGGLALDAQVPGTLMVATDNLWYPDVQIFRSTNSGNTWSNIWDYNDLYYTYNTNKAPWINNSRQPTDTKVLGWMVASLEIDPFDSNHWLYGTGETLYGGHDLTKFPYVLVQSLADGIEEESVQALIAPPGGAPLLSAVGDDCGFRHVSLDISPNNTFQNPYYATTADLDYAGMKPLYIVRIGNSNSDGDSQMALSTDGGVSWNPATVSSTSIAGGQVAYGADGVNIVWVSESGTYRFSNGAQSTISLSSSVKIASDKVNGNYFYAVDQNSVYVSSDGGATWPVSTSLSNSGINAVKVHPLVAGDVWVSTSSGLYHSTNFGKTFSEISAVTSSDAIALGKGTGAYPNIYGFLSTGGATTLQVSTDMGVTWTVISDSGHGFGASGANCLAASMDTTGLVFVGTNGRGIFYGLPSGSTSSSSIGPTSTQTSSTSKTSLTSMTSKSTMTTMTPSTTSPITPISTVTLTSTQGPPSTTSTGCGPLSTFTSTVIVTVTMSPSMTSTPAPPMSTTSTPPPHTSTTSTTSVIAPPPPCAPAAHWAQCGGIGFTGCTTCVAGTTCTYSNPYYSQCL